MPPKQTPPARATRSGGPPDTAPQPPKKKQKKGQTKNTDTSAPVRTEAERDAMLARMEKDLAELDASLAATASPGMYGLTAAETTLGMQALQKVKESLGDLSATNIGSVLAFGLVQAKALVDNTALLRPPGLDPPSRPASTESPAPKASPSEDCVLTSRPPHELLLVTIIQYLVVKFLTDFKPAPPKTLSSTQTLTLTSMTLDASRLPLARSFFDLVAILKLVASFSSDLFDSNSAKDKAARFMAELIQKVSNTLNASLASLASNQTLLETCAPEVFLQIRTTPPADIDILAVLESSLNDLITSFAGSHRKEAMRAARVSRALDALKLAQSQQSPPTATQYVSSSYSPPALAHSRAPPPPPVPGSVATRPGVLPGQGNRACRFAVANNYACALCGKGSTPGSVGHRASSCPADVCGRQPAVEAQDRVEAGEAGPVSRRDRWVGVCLCESAGRGGAGPSGD